MSTQEEGKYPHRVYYWTCPVCRYTIKTLSDKPPKLPCENCKFRKPS